ncbi:MAG TPA: TIGR02996 domain-containing protein [Gemmata sp.]
MNDHDALLRAIGEQPEEDTPRLMYADWLEENDQPERADFVRNQIALNQPGLSAAERGPLVRKNRSYLTNWVPQWRAQLPPIRGIEWGDFRRGLIEEVQAHEESPVIRHATEIFAVPGIHCLRLRWLNDGRGLAGVPELERLRALRLVASRAAAPVLRELLGAGSLRRLTVLDLHGNRADDAVAADLADGRFPELTELWLGSNQIGAPGGRALAASPHLGKLRVLDLRNNNIDHPTRTALVRTFGSRAKL